MNGAVTTIAEETAHGPRALLPFRAASRLYRLAPHPSRASFQAILFRQRLPGSTPAEAARGFEVHEASPAELETIRGEPENHRPAKVYRNRLEHGHRVFVAVSAEDEILAYNWVARDACYRRAGFPDEFSFLPLTPRRAFLYDLYTFERHRRRGAGRAVKWGIARALERLGVEECLTLVMADNHASIALQRSLGARPVSFVYGYRLGPWRKVFHGYRRDTEGLAGWWDRGAPGR